LLLDPAHTHATCDDILSNGCRASKPAPPKVRTSYLDEDIVRLHVAIGAGHRGGGTPWRDRPKLPKYPQGIDIRVDVVGREYSGCEGLLLN
jgi:hypothetical protein